MARIMTTAKHIPTMAPGVSGEEGGEEVEEGDGVVMQSSGGDVGSMKYVRYGNEKT